MMNNEEDKRCPLCAEEMDWTDQQFKPCKCGYQVCVWCWHQIIDMAEKDETEGRCPACRVVYEKEKIVAAQANCERTISKNLNCKTRPPKSKPKTNEVKKDLTNVRVIQRKMAYVIGLPLCLADEDLLQRKEYFGQYGKINKISLSRTAGGAIQQFVNDTFSVYVTFSKEEEALRCIRWVHGFVLEGKFLRASFGTAKYCHAWLKNTPCSNSACLYLHSIGADEDSFGKDEAASIHTRNRVQEMAGISNLWVKRSGSILPPPVDDLYISTSTIPEKYAVESPVSDEAHGFTNSSIETNCSLPSREREESSAIPQKVTSFVDIVGRSNISAPERDGNIPEDKRTLQLDSEISQVSIGGEMHPMEPYSVPNMFKVSSCNDIGNGNGLFENISYEPLRDDSHLFYSQGSKDTIASSERACFLQPSNSASILEAGGSASLHKKTHSLNDINVVQNAVYNHDGGASSPIKCVNTALNDVCQEMKFQNSAKSDKIYRNSNSFSNEEIVEHLRRIDGDNLTNDGEASALNVVESSIISNIMSIDFDSCEDSLTIPGGLSQVTDGMHDSSWNSFNNDQLGYSFVKQGGFSCQSAGSVRPEFGDGKDKYLSNSPYLGTRFQSLAPPGFSVPSRDPPPGFSTCERTGFLPRASSVGGHLGNSSFSSNLLQQQPHPTGGGFSSSSSMNNVVDFIDPAIVSCGKPTNEMKTPGGFEMSGGNIINHPPQMMNSTFEDNAKLWFLIQQSATAKNRDSNYSQMFVPPQTSPNYTSSSHNHHNIENGVSALENMYGGLSSSSRPVDLLHQNYNPSSYPQLPHQKFTNGHISSNNNNNTNGYLHSSMTEFRHKGEAGGMTELERLGGGIDKYFPGYSDSMFNSGDLYNRLFGL